MNKNSKKKSNKPTSGGRSGARQNAKQVTKQGSRQNGNRQSFAKSSSDKQRFSKGGAKNSSKQSLHSSKATDTKAKKNNKNKQESASSEHNQIIQWYPGHMTKTKRRIEKDLKLVDAVAEIIDARIPISSRNPDIANLTTGKPRIVLLNKCDMADPKSTAKWVEYLSKENIRAIPVDCKSGRGVDRFVPVLKELLSKRIESYKAKGMINPSMRVMIVGIPNVGKSTFINRISRKTKAVSADRPGVTRGNQWFTVGKGFEMLDTPGVLWPRFDDQKVGEHLAFTGAIKSEVMDTELLAVRLLDLLKKLETPEFFERYKLNEEDTQLPSYELLEVIGKRRGMLISGGEVDTDRAAYILLDEFRAGKLGKVTLELPDQGA